MTRQRRTPTPILGVYVCTMTNLSDVLKLDKVVETTVKGRRNRATFQMLKNYIRRFQSSRPVGFTHKKKKKRGGGGQRDRQTYNSRKLS